MTRPVLVVSMMLIPHLFACPAPVQQRAIPLTGVGTEALSTLDGSGYGANSCQEEVRAIDDCAGQPALLLQPTTYECANKPPAAQLAIPFTIKRGAVYEFAWTWDYAGMDPVDATLSTPLNEVRATSDAPYMFDGNGLAFGTDGTGTFGTKPFQFERLALDPSADDNLGASGNFKWQFIDGSGCGDGRIRASIRCLQPAPTNLTRATALTMRAGGDKKAGTVSCAGQRWFKFEAPGASDIKLGLMGYVMPKTPLFGQEAQLFATLVDSSGNEVMSSGNPYGTNIAMRTNQASLRDAVSAESSPALRVNAGTYFVRVDQSGSCGTVKFELSLSI